MSDTGASDHGQDCSDLHIPAIPQALPKVLAPIHNSGFAGREAIFAAVDCDPDIGDTVVKYLNTQVRRPVEDLERAVQLIGPTTTAGLIIWLSIRRLSTLRNGPAGSRFLRLVYHCEATAVLTKHILQKGLVGGAVQPEDNEEESPAHFGFVKGFVHDLGKLVLTYNDPQKAANLYRPKRTKRGYEGTEPDAIERRAFGCDHKAAGAYAAQQLNLSESLVRIIKDHHNEEMLAGEGTMARDLRAVRAANLAVKTMGPEFAGLSPIQATLDWESCRTDPVWTYWQSESAAADPRAMVEALEKELVLYTKFFLELPDVQRLSQFGE